MVLGNGGNGKAKRWIHSSDSLVNGRINYTVKFVGKAEVPEPRGMPMVKAALQKLSFSRQLKRSEGSKPPKVELGINIHSVTISDVRTKEVIHNIGLHRVSFCADDKEDKRLFAFIAKLDDDKHYCYGLDSLHQANDITLTIGQAFEVAYERFLQEKPQTDDSKKVSNMSKRIQELESENSDLRRRIEELEATQNLVQNGSGSTTVLPRVTTQQSSASSPDFNVCNLALPRRSGQALAAARNPQQEVIDVFNMQPFAPSTTVARLPQPPSRKPVKAQANLWEGSDLFDSTRTTKELMDMQNAFGKGIAISNENLTLDSFDPLKH